MIYLTMIYFLVGNRFFGQNKGSAIGGIISAQLAELFGICKELYFLSQTKQTQANQQAKYLPARALVRHPYRFRYTIVGVLRGKIG